MVHGKLNTYFFGCAYADAEREFLLFDGPGGCMGLAFLFWCRDLFFARKKREKNVGAFFGVFGGVVSLLCSHH